MNRRSFLQTLLGVGAATVAAPSLPLLPATPGDLSPVVIDVDLPGGPCASMAELYDELWAGWKGR